MRRKRWQVWALGFSAAVLLSSCTVGADGDTPDNGSGASRCSLSAQGVPSCGVLWGISSPPPTLEQLDRVEDAAGRPFDFVYRYHDINDEVPDAEGRAVVAQGRLLHIAIAARDFRDADRTPVTWAEVAQGKYDRDLTKQAEGIASLKKPIFVTFEQEANQAEKLGVEGDAEDFKAAWRHLHDLYRDAGATNAVWTWVMTGNPDNLSRAASLWPGNEFVDWISWNVYNQSGCHSGIIEPEKFRSFDEEVRPFYDFVHKRGPSIGMDTDKPMMISEAGSVRYPDAPELAAGWYASIPTTLRDYPKIKAVALWDSVNETCDYDFDADPEVVEGVRTAGLDPYLDIRGALSPKT